MKNQSSINEKTEEIQQSICSDYNTTSLFTSPEPLLQIHLFGVGVRMLSTGICFFVKEMPRCPIKWFHFDCVMLGS